MFDDDMNIVLDGITIGLSGEDWIEDDDDEDEED